MILELYIFFEILVIFLFVSAFFTKQEILWGITVLISALLMYESYNVEYYILKFNLSINDYNLITISNSYPYLAAVNLLFFVLSLVLLIFDLFDKYGSKLKG